MIQTIPQRWKVLSGERNWHNLLSPLDGDLQDYLLHYGSMAEATYDTFNSEKNSKYAGGSKYSRKDLFSKVGLVSGNPFTYRAVKYIYAMSDISLPDSFLLKPTFTDSWCESSNWMAFVAVATDEGKRALGRRDILVAWRGTIQTTEWIEDFDFPLVSASTIVGKAEGGKRARVHKGLLSLYTSHDPDSKLNKKSAREQVVSAVTRLLEQYAEEEVSITVTGHSLGGGLSTLSAADIVCNGHNKGCQVTAFLFGSLRPGDTRFKNAVNSMKDIHILNVVNGPDVVPLVPPGAEYDNIGIELRLDSSNSSYLKPGNPIAWHDLEAGYLHGVAMENGREDKRDFRLVNKTEDALKDEYSVPTNWWIERNKGMVQLADGKWALQDHQDDDDDPK